MASIIPYPYPVLGNNEEIEGSFTPSMTYSLTPAEITLKVQMELSNNYFRNLIEEGRASFLIDVSCARTYFRKTYKTTANYITINEPAETMRGKVDVAFYICTNEALDDYCPAGGEFFYVESGDIIALGGDASFSAEKEYDPLKAPVRSIIKIMRTESRQDEFSVNYDADEYITIHMPKEMHELYTGIRSGATDVLHSAIVLPALMDAITVAKEPEYSGNSWALKLREICESRNIDPDADPIVIAQKILDNPVNRSLSWCKKALGEEDD